jgi:hypothetical protein
MQGFRKLFLVFTVGCFLSAGFQMPATASMVSNSDIQQSVSMEMKRDQIKTMLAREDVQKQLASFGVDQADAESRVDQLTDAEVLAFHEQMEDLPAGGVLGAILLIIVIFMLLDVAGVTDVFPNI